MILAAFDLKFLHELAVTAVELQIGGTRPHISAWLAIR
jgi:hypothetical protein